jgi:hypothetical protein
MVCLEIWDSQRKWFHGHMVREVLEGAPHSYFVLMSASRSYGLPWNMIRSNLTNSIVSWSEGYLKTLNTIILSLWVHGLMVCLKIWDSQMEPTSWSHGQRGIWRRSTQICCPYECIMVSWSALKYDTFKRNQLRGLMVRVVFEDAQHSYFVAMSAWSHGLPWNMRQSNVIDFMVSWSEGYLMVSLEIWDWQCCHTPDAMGIFFLVVWSAIINFKIF